VREISGLVRDNVKRLKPFSSARAEYKGDADIFLDANENPFNNGVNRYPDPHQIKLKEMLSEIKGISAKNILLGNGSDEVLDLIFRAFCEPKEDNVITLPPTYGMYEVLANTNAVDILKVRLTKDFQPNVNAILEASNANSKILFLCSPNNPTANSFESEKIEKLLREFNGLVVIDEAYIDFSVEESWISKLDSLPNLIVTQTLSKAYGLAGIRLGICYASQEIIDTLKKIKPPYNINELTQQKAIHRMSYVSGVKNEIKILKEERDRLILELNTIALIEKVYPSDANFLLVKVDDANKRYNQLINNGIVIRNRTNQPLCNNCLRFTVGTSRENTKLLEALKTL